MQMSNVYYYRELLYQILYTQHSYIIIARTNNNNNNHNCAFLHCFVKCVIVLSPVKLDTGKVAVTVVVAGDVIYLAQENFHHWPLPRLQELPPREVLEPPFSYVEEKEVTDIEQIVSVTRKDHLFSYLFSLCWYILYNYVNRLIFSKF